MPPGQEAIDWAPPVLITTAMEQSMGGGVGR